MQNEWILARFHFFTSDPGSHEPSPEHTFWRTQVRFAGVHLSSENSAHILQFY